MRIAPIAVVAAAGAMFASAPGAGDVVVFRFALEGSQEVPPVNTPGTGEATVTLDTDTGEVTVTGEYRDLVSDALAAHIHGPADPGQNAGVLIGLIIDGGTSGMISGSGTLQPGHIDEMLNGRTYVNVHSNMHSGGEIRGQVVPCAADMNLDGMADVSDFFTFLDFFADGDNRADMDGDGDLDVDDFFLFLDLFADGCV